VTPSKAQIQTKLKKENNDRTPSLSLWREYAWENRYLDKRTSLGFTGLYLTQAIPYDDAKVGAAVEVIYESKDGKTSKTFDALDCPRQKTAGCKHSHN